MKYLLIATIALGNPTHWDYLHFDPPSHRLFISHGDHVDVLDTKTDKIIGTLAPLPGSHGIAVDPVTGNIWADSAGTSTAIAFNPITFKPVAHVTVVEDADGMAYDPASKQIFNTGGDGMAITPITPATATAGPNIALGTSPEFLAADGQGNLYDNLETANEIIRINTSTDKIIARWPLTTCTHPKGMAVDGPNRLVFASCANGVMVVLNADTGRLEATLPIGKGTDAAAFNPTTHTAYASAGDGTISLIAEQPTLHVAGVVKTAKGARTMAVDPATGDLFTVTATVTGSTAPNHFTYAPGTLHVLIYAPGP
jgi:DNA-binding beta-propeller fold protein YncE